MLYQMHKENAKDTPGVTRKKIKFGDDEYQYALVMRPVKSAEPKRNTIFFIHGGGWAAGSAELFSFVGSFFSMLGFNVIVGGYRHAPKYKYPAQLEDVYSSLAAGIKELQAQGAEADRIIVVGQSAGAQLAGLLVLDEENAREQGLDPEIFSAMMLISGPLDFSVCNARQIKLGLHGFLDSKNEYISADPIRLVKENANKPVLCIHGNRDPIVDIRNSVNFYNRVKDGGNRVSKLVIANNKHHLDLLGLFMRNTAETRALIKFMYEIEKNVNK
jgi:acetyl esterase/lipase